MKVQLVENVLKANDEIAVMNREIIKKHNIFAIDIIGAPGCGKTALLEQTTQLLQPDLKVGIVVGDLATQRDADRLAKWCDQVVQINTGKGCHLEAHHVRMALEKMDLSRIDVLFIENVGNLICPVGFDLGQNAKVGVFSVCGGDDKAAKHPFIVYESSLLLLTKSDLLPHIPFNLELFKSDVKTLNPKVEMMELTTRDPKSFSGWVQWIKSRRNG